VSLRLIEYDSLVWASAFALLSLSAAFAATRRGSAHLWAATACAGVVSAFWLARFAIHQLVPAQCVEERCLLPAPYAALMFSSTTIIPWLVLVGSMILLHYALRCAKQHGDGSE